MISGVIASQASTDVEGSFLADPLTDIQFAAGTATIGGVAVDLTTLISLPEHLVMGQGLVTGADKSCQLLGDLADLILADDWVIVIDWYRPSTFCAPFEVSDGTHVAATAMIRIEESDGGVFVFDTHDSTFNRDIFDDDAVAGPVSRAIAIRHSDAQFTMSLDQQNVQFSDPNIASTMPALTDAWIGGDSFTAFGPVVVRRLRVFSGAEVGNELLASLSRSEGYGTPVNDSFASAISLEVGTEVYVCSNACTKETGEPDHGGETGGASVWYEFTAPGSATYTVIIWGWTLLTEPITAVYTGSAVGSLSSVAFDVNNDWEVTFAATMGTSYKIALDGVGGEEGFFSVRISDGAVNGVGAAHGVGAASGVGAVSGFGSGVGTAGGVGSASGVGSTGTVNGVGSASGVGAVSGVGAGSLWTPASLGSALVLWIKADTLAGSDGDPVTTWPDASGNSRDATGSGTARPTLRTAALNSMNVVEFDASQLDRMDFPNFATSYTAGSTVFVFKADADPAVSTATGGGPFTAGTSANSDHVPFTDGTVYSGWGSTARKTTVNPTTSLTNWGIGGYRSAASDWKFYLNGVQLYTTATNTVGFSSVLKLGTIGITAYWDGRLAEVVMTNTAISSTDREKVEGYLAHKWGLTSVLDSGHPYKTTPPT